MKVAPILVLCLAVSIHQVSARASIFDGISDGIRKAGSIAEGAADAAGSAASGAAQTAGNIASGIAQGASGAAQGAIGAATGMAKGAIGIGTGIASGMADKAASVAKAIGENIQKVQNRALKGALQNAQSSLQKIQDHTRGVLQASEVAAKNAQEGLIEVEDKKTELIAQWAEKAKSKLANASPETQEKGEDLINAFASARSEDIKKASDNVLETLEELQEKANATAAKYHEPMNQLIEQVGKCSELKVTQIRELVKCGAAIQKDLGPLASAPGALASVKAQLLKAAGQNIVKDIRVKNAINQFRNQSKQVEAILDQLVAREQQNKEQNPEKDVDDQSEEGQGQEEEKQSEEQSEEQSGEQDKEDQDQEKDQE